MSLFMRSIVSCPIKAKTVQLICEFRSSHIAAFRLLLKYNCILNNAWAATFSRCTSALEKGPSSRVVGKKVQLQQSQDPDNNLCKLWRVFFALRIN